MSLIVSVRMQVWAALHLGSAAARTASMGRASMAAASAGEPFKILVACMQHRQCSHSVFDESLTHARIES